MREVYAPELFSWHFREDVLPIPTDAAQEPPQLAVRLEPEIPHQSFDSAVVIFRMAILFSVPVRRA